MELEALSKLSRAELQRLAKSKGVRAVGKNADIIKRLCANTEAQSSGTIQNAGMVAETTAVTEVRTRRELRKKPTVVRDSTGRGSNATPESFPQPEEEVASTASPAGGPDSHSRLSAISPHSRLRHNSVAPANGVSTPSRNTFSANAPHNSQTITRAEKAQATPETGSRQDEHQASVQPMPTEGPSHRHSTPDSLPDYEEVMKMPDWDTNRAANDAMNRTRSRPESPVIPAASEPIVVGEREGEPGYQDTMPSTTNARPMRRSSSQETTRTNNTATTVLASSPLQRPSRVPGSYGETDSDDSEARRISRRWQQFASLSVGDADKLEYTHPTLADLQDALYDAKEKALRYPAVKDDVERLERIIRVIQKKELWMDKRLREVQELRLAIEQHYLPYVKNRPDILGYRAPQQKSEEEFFMEDGSSVRGRAQAAPPRNVREEIGQLHVSPREGRRFNQNKRGADDAEVACDASSKRMRTVR